LKFSHSCQKTDKIARLKMFYVRNLIFGHWV